MKKTGATFITFALFLLMPISCDTHRDEKDYLKQVLSHLEKIESAGYYVTKQAWNPGDTTPVYTKTYYTEEYKNPADTTIGASYVELETYEDEQRLYFAYDGQARLLVNHELKAFMLDDFTTQNAPYRPVWPPFFSYTENIIHYMLTTNDSITTETAITKDTYHFKWTIHEDSQVEFFWKTPLLYQPLL